MGLYADAVYLNGRVITISSPPWAQAFAIRGGRFVIVGSNEETRPYVGPGTEVHDLEGRTVLPGIIDSHNHLLHGGLDLLRPQVSSATCIDDILGMVKKAGQMSTPGQWLVTSTLDRTRLRENRFPTRWELDHVCQDRPVCIPSPHLVALNSLALSLVGINRDTPDLVGGKIMRHPEDGEPTGILQGRPAVALVEGYLPVPTREQRTRAITTMAQRLNAVGITSVTEPALGPDDIRAYQDLWAQGKLTLRVNLRLAVPADRFSIPHCKDILRGLGFYTGFGDEWLRLGSLKFILDGGLIQKTAYLLESYASDDREHGLQLLPSDHLKELVCEANRLGWQVAAHASGDGAVEQFIEACEVADQECPIAARRFVVIHAHVPSSEQLKRVAKLGMVGELQPVWVCKAGRRICSLLRPGQVARYIPLREWMKTGIVVGLSSDFPINHYNPFLGMWAAVSRTAEDGSILQPEQRVSREECLRMYTLNNAFLTFEEQIKGSVAAGKRADFLVTSADPLTCPEEELKEIKVLLTAIGGKTV